MTGKGRLSATNLASHQHLGCDLFLYNVYHGLENHNAYNPKDSSKVSELSKAQFERGNDWEAMLFNWLDVEGLLLTVASGPLDGWDIREIIELDERSHFFIAGLRFWPPNAALKAAFRKAGSSSVEFGLAKPDLLEVSREEDGSWAWRVIDAKSSKAVHTSHLVQIYFYTECLQHLLPQSHFRFMNTAAVWLPPPGDIGSSIPSYSGLKIVRASHLSDTLQEFLFRKLPELLALPRKEVEWHYNPLCRHCPYDSDCRSRALLDQTLGSIPNVSLDDAKNLRTLVDTAHRLGNRRKSTNELTDIEELHGVLQDPAKMAALRMRLPSTMKKAKRILALSTKKNFERTRRSAVIEAARTHTVKVIHRANFTFPMSEDIAVVLSIVQDPGTLRIASFCLSVFSSAPSFDSRTCHGRRDELVSQITVVVRDILNFQSTVHPVPRTQFYVFSSSEHAALQEHLIETALTTDLADQPSQEAIRLSVGALCEGANLLSTRFQPIILSGALFDFVGKGKTKTELKICLERLGLSTAGTVDQLRSRWQEEIERLKEEGGRSIANPTSGDDKRSELGQLPRVVVVKKQVESLLALPIPGYWDLLECASVLLGGDTDCATDEKIFQQYKRGQQSQLEDSLGQRNLVVFKIIQELRTRVLSAGKAHLIVNHARVLSVNFMDICKEERLRKLFFMQQFEILAKLMGLWRARIEGCQDAPTLEFKYTSDTNTGAFNRWFKLISGRLDMPPDKYRTFFDYLLVEDVEDGVHDVGSDNTGLPVEAFFDDLGVSGLVFPLNRYTKSRWGNQHVAVQQGLLVADLRDMVIEGSETRVLLQTWGGPGFKLTPGHRYRLSPRLVDFNITKTLSTILELDLRCDQCLNDESRWFNVPFLHIVSDPHSFGTELENSAAVMKSAATIHHLFRERQSLGSEAAGALVLKSSQRKAVNRILTHRLTVIWGPPGTGKTYTIALALLRLLDAQSRLGGLTRQIVFLTAMTHAAIQACLDKLTYLTGCYHQIEGLPVAWLDNVKIERVVEGYNHPAPVDNSRYTYVYAGTVYQLYNFSKRHAFGVDCVFIDEAGQLTLGSAALVLRSLNSTGRVVVSGDSEQLPPILTAQYPQLARPLFGSILDCLMAKREVYDLPLSPSPSEFSATQSTIVQLTENFRLNPDLGDFVATIYKRAFQPQKVQTKQIAVRLQSITENPRDGVLRNAQSFLLALSNVMLRKPQTLLKPPSRKPGIASHNASSHAGVDLPPHPISLALIRLKTRSTRTEQIAYEVHVRGEAVVAAALVKTIRSCSPDDDIFVVTPHRVQRQAVKEALRAGSHCELDQVDDLSDALKRMSISESLDGVRVDTAERLQGSEAAFVICLFSHSSSMEVGFLLERRRLNVAISRAKTLCILVSSDEVLRPSVKVLANEESAKGYAFLRAFEERSWSATLPLDLDPFH